MSEVRSTAALRQKLFGIQALVRLRRVAALYRKYSDDQPRIPAGQPDGGQFTFGGGDKPTADRRMRLAQNRPRGGGRFGRWPDATPGQQARLAASEIQANNAMSRVREIDGTWTPSPGIYENIEGEILSNESVLQQARARYEALQRATATSGPFAHESTMASPSGKRTDAATQREVDRIGRVTGCHTCGTFVPGTRDGSFIGDHQPPTALGGSAEQRLFPQCLACSRSQGGFVTGLKRSR